MKIKTKSDRRERIRLRQRKRITGTAARPRLAVFRSVAHIYAQVIDDQASATIAERLIEKGVKRVVFDRNGFLYHGRVKAVADAAREAGLEF